MSLLVGKAEPVSPLLELQGICKRFASTVALDNVHLRLHPSEVLGLVGENGAGKSTLMRILAGIVPPDAGNLMLAGNTVRVTSPTKAAKLGIAIIHQEIHLCSNLEIAANVFLGREPTRWGMLDSGRMRRESATYFHQVGLSSRPRTIAGTLSIGKQQLVEIARALAMQARILIMDEPTASLSAGESDNLFRVINELRQRGVAIIYISHRLGEIERVADRVSVLRDGRNAGELARNEIDHHRMVRLMIGRDVPPRRTTSSNGSRTVGLELKGVRTHAYPHHPVSLQVHCGETVGLAGLIGAGRSELLQTIFGISPALSGTIRVAGAAATIRHSADATRLGISLVPEDRKTEGLVLSLPIEPNAAMASLDQRLKYGCFVDDRATRAEVGRAMLQLQVRAASLHQQPVQFLSGGNQQKVVLGKWLLRKPKVLLLDEPTRGVDVGARAQLYDQLADLKAQGVAILFASSEMEEILALSDRILVMHEGTISGELAGPQATEEAVMLLATGKKGG
jgi:ribose transport system ATP-binding protein